MWSWKWIPPVVIYNPEEALPGFYAVYEDNAVDAQPTFFFYIQENRANDSRMDTLVRTYNALRREEARVG